MDIIKFQLIDLYEPKDLGENRYDHPDYYDQASFRMDFIQNVKLGRVTLKGGSVHWIAKCNLAGGTCGCCVNFHLDDVVKFESFALIQE